MLGRVFAGVQWHTASAARRFSNGSKSYARGRRAWSLEEFEQVKEMKAMGLDRATIAAKLGRSYASIDTFTRRCKKQTRGHDKDSEMPPNKRLWTPEEDTKLQQLRNECMPRRQIAKALQRSFMAVNGRLHRLGLMSESSRKPKSTPRQKWTQAEHECMLKLQAEGMSLKQISEALHRSLGSVKSRHSYNLNCSQDDHIRSTLTAKDLDQAQDWYLAGKKLQDIHAALPKYTYDQISFAVRKVRRRKGLQSNVPWSREEIETVISLRKSGLSFNDIAASLPGRSPGACRELHFRHNGLPRYVQWSREEIETVISLRRSGLSFKGIAASLPGRSQKACEQIHSRHNGLLRVVRWTREEIEKVISLRKSGTSYPDIAALLPGRSKNACWQIHSRNTSGRQGTIDE